MDENLNNRPRRYTRREDYSEMLLAENGICRCVAVISAEASEKVRAAARDFCDLLQRMSGGVCRILTDRDPLPIDLNPVFIGASDYTAQMGIAPFRGYPENEHILLRRDGDRLVLMGNDDGAYYGTQFAVTTLFERLGCGWFGPDELWQVIPEQKTISVGYLNIDKKPTFISRFNNVLRAYPEIGRRWYLGGDRRISGHGFPFMVPRDENFKTHPEWFCEIDGKRNPYVDWWQYCYSNDEIAQVLADKICEKFEREPDLIQYSIAMNDGWYHGWCQCEKCKALGTPTETTIYFANKLARLIGKRFPKHRLTFLAYFPTYFPPRTKMKLEPNLEVMFCKEADMFMPVDKGPDNGYHLRYHHRHSKNTYPAPWRENFEKWDEMVEMNHKAIWDWYCIAAAYPPWQHIPWVQGDVCTRNNRFWHDHGVEYVYNDQGPLMPAFFEDGSSFPLRFPLWHVAAKSWWDGDLTGSDILMDDCRKLYGSAKDLMFAYYSALADIAVHNTGYSIGWHPPKPCELYTPEAIARVDVIMAAIRALIPAEEERVARRLQIQVDLWEKAKATIAEDAKNPDVDLV